MKHTSYISLCEMLYLTQFVLLLFLPSAGKKYTEFLTEHYHSYPLFKNAFMN